VVFETMHFVDHLLVLILAVGYPIYSAVDNRRYVREIKAGKPANVAKAYRETMIYQWVGLAFLAAAWIALRRPSADLGFNTPAGVSTSASDCSHSATAS
jgi:hypothetical protein